MTDVESLVGISVSMVERVEMIVANPEQFRIFGIAVRNTRCWASSHDNNWLSKSNLWR